MRKSSKILLGITIVCVALVGVSIYTIKTYNNAKAKPSVENSLQNSTTKNKVTKEPSVIKPNVIKTKAPDFKLKDIDGKEFSLSDLKGKKVFLNFWATWCPPCRNEMPEIQKLYEETKETDLVIIAVDIGEPLSDVKSFVYENKYNFKVLLDSDQSTASQYKISSIPTSYFIDVDGNVISKISGGLSIDQMKSYIEKLDR